MGLAAKADEAEADVSKMIKSIEEKSCFMIPHKR
jgi:hypothetical protein